MEKMNCKEFEDIIDACAYALHAEIEEREYIANELGLDVSLFEGMHKGVEAMNKLIINYSKSMFKLD